MIAENMKFIVDRASVLANEVHCKYGSMAPLVLLAGVFLKLGKLVQTMTFGANKWDITPVELNTVARKILAKDDRGLVRKVALWIDSSSGGPTPTIRVGRGGLTSNSGGIRVSAGQVNEIGEVPPDVELWAAASTTIVAYVLERA